MKSTRLPLFSSNQTYAGVLWDMLLTSFCKQLLFFLFIFTNSTPAVQLKPPFSGSCSSRSVYLYFPGRENQEPALSQTEILATGQKGRWDRIQLSYLLCQRRKSSAKMSSSGKKGKWKRKYYNEGKEWDEMHLVIKTGDVFTFYWYIVGRGESWYPNGFAAGTVCSLGWKLAGRWKK